MAKKSKKLEEIHNLFLENNISAETLEQTDEVIFEIKKRAEYIKDPRHQSYVRHLLVDIVMIVFFAVLGNANEWGEIGSFAKKKEKWLRKYLELPYGIPSDDTIRVVMGNLDSTHFYSLVVSFLIDTMNRILNMAGKSESDFERDIIAVDGKETTGSKRATTDRETVKALRTLNVYSTGYGICIGQEFIEEKTNEIPAAQEALKYIDIRGSIITSDAMNAQRDTAKIIIKGKADYVLALKGNQPLLYAEVKEFMTEDVLKEIKEKGTGYKKTIEKEHSALVIREYYITDETDWYADRSKWMGMQSFGMVRKSTQKKNGETINEDRHYICSIEQDAELFESAARGHWGVENNLHWSLDFTFRDDKNTTMDKTGAKNLQLAKKIVLSILNIVKGTYKKSLKKIRYELSLDYENGAEQLLSMLSLNSITKALNK